MVSGVEKRVIMKGQGKVNDGQERQVIEYREHVDDWSGR